jgi:hypothetical protein
MSSEITMAQAARTGTEPRSPRRHGGDQDGERDAGKRHVERMAMLAEIDGGE